MMGDSGKAGFQHGTLSGYTHHRCRCPECKEAKAAYARDKGSNVRTGAVAETKRRYDRRRATERKDGAA